MVGSKNPCLIFAFWYSLKNEIDLLSGSSYIVCKKREASFYCTFFQSMKI